MLGTDMQARRVRVKEGQVIFDLVNGNGETIAGDLAMLLGNRFPVRKNGKHGTRGINGEVLKGPMLDAAVTKIIKSEHIANLDRGPIYAAILFADGAQTHHMQLNRHPISNFSELV